MKNKNVGQIFSEFIKKHHITQGDLGQIVGLRENMVNKYINGVFKGSELKKGKFEKLMKEWEEKLSISEKLEYPHTPNTDRLQELEDRIKTLEGNVMKLMSKFI